MTEKQFKNHLLDGYAIPLALAEQARLRYGLLHLQHKAWADAVRRYQARARIEAQAMAARQPIEAQA